MILVVLFSLFFASSTALTIAIVNASTINAPLNLVKLGVVFLIMIGSGLGANIYIRPDFYAKHIKKHYHRKELEVQSSTQSTIKEGQ